jgi:hypothetical protein
MRKKNYNYTIQGEMTIIHLTTRKGLNFDIIIDTEDLNKVINFPYKWCVAKNHSGYYARATQYLGMFDGEFKYITPELHRFLIDAKENEFVDHINHNTLDNRKSNLRIATNDENTKHREGKNKNNKSGYRNVCWHTKEGKWFVQLQINGRNTVLGKFNDIDEAGSFANEMREKYYGEFAGAS